MARAWVARMEWAAGPAVEIRPDAHRAVMAPLLRGLLRDELRRREFGGSLLLTERPLASGADSAGIHFFRGEVYRLRDEQGDDARAVAALSLALQGDRASAEVHRSLGLIYMKRGEAGLARPAFTHRDAVERMIDSVRIDARPRRPRSAYAVHGVAVRQENEG